MGKVIVVTGGGRGIGAATARLAAERGYTVCVNYVRESESAGRVVDACRRAGANAVAVQADVSVEADVVRLFETVTRDLGRVTALVNNAGILERQMRVEEMDAGRIARVFAVNVTGPFLCCREAVRRMSTKRDCIYSGILTTLWMPCALWYLHSTIRRSLSRSAMTSTSCFTQCPCTMMPV